MPKKAKFLHTLVTMWPKIRLRFLFQGCPERRQVYHFPVIQQRTLWPEAPSSSSHKVFLLWEENGSYSIFTKGQISHGIQSKWNLFRVCEPLGMYNLPNLVLWFHPLSPCIWLYNLLVTFALFKRDSQKIASLVAQLVKNPPAMQDTLVRFLYQEDSLEKG